MWYLNGKLISQGEQPENWDELVTRYLVQSIMES